MNFAEALIYNLACIAEELERIADEIVTMNQKEDSDD